MTTQDPIRLFGLGLGPGNPDYMTVRARRVLETADRLVVARPGFSELETIAPGVRLAGTASGPVDEVACDLPAARDLGTVPARVR